MLNELFRSYKKIIALVVLIGSGIIFWFFGCHRESAPEAPLIKWEKTSFHDGGYGYQFETNSLKGLVVFGIKGYTVADKSIPVYVNIDSAKEDFEGIVKISVPGSSSNGVAYQSALQCKKNEPKKMFFTVPQLGNASYFCFEIQDQYGNVILSEIERSAYAQWNSNEDGWDYQICLGILSDEASQLTFFDELLLNQGNENVSIRSISFNEQDFPDNIEALRMLSGVLIDDFNVQKLSKKQKNILFSWVKGGGHLIIATGEYGNKTLKGFEEEFKVQSGDVETGRLYFGDAASFSGEIGLYLNQLSFIKDAGWKMVEWSEPASFYEKNYGKGLVQVLRFSFTDKTLLQWKRLNEMSKSIMSKLLMGVFEKDDNEANELWSMEMALNDFIRSQMPNAFYYGIFFIVYLSFLAFIAYFFLRRRNKRELIWIVVPLLSIFFTTCLLLRSRGNSSNMNMTQNSLSAIRIVDDQSRINEIYFLYQNAEGESKSLDFISAIDEVKPLDYEYAKENVDSVRFRRIKDDYTISHTIKGHNIVFSETTPGTLRMLEMTENKSMNYAEKDVHFSAELLGKHTTFSGRITNNSGKDFDKLLVVRGNEYWTHGKTKSGDTITIREEDVSCYAKGMDVEEKMVDDSDNIVIQDIMSYLSNRYMKDNNHLDDFVIVGITLADKYQLLKGGEILGNQVCVYASHSAVDIPEKADCQVNINDDNLVSPKLQEDIASQLEETGKAEAEYHFDKNKIAWVMARCKDDFEGKILAYNYETEEWDEILSKKHERMYCEELEPYLSEDNIMKLTYKCTEETMNSAVPILSIWMKKNIR